MRWIEITENLPFFLAFRTSSWSIRVWCVAWLLLLLYDVTASCLSSKGHPCFVPVLVMVSYSPSSKSGTEWRKTCKGQGRVVFSGKCARPGKLGSFHKACWNRPTWAQRVYFLNSQDFCEAVIKNNYDCKLNYPHLNESQPKQKC